MRGLGKKLVTIGMAAALTVASLAGCGGDRQSGGEGKEEELAVVKTAYSPFIGGIGIYVIDEKEMDKKNGIDLQIGAYGNTSTVMSLMTGEVDIAFTTIQGYLVSVDSLLKEGYSIDQVPKIVYLHNESTGADGLVAKSDITSLEQLKGKKVSAQYGNVTQYMLAKALAKAGLTIADVDFVDMSPGKGGSAFIAGNLDAATTFDPYLTQAVNETKANLLITTKDLERCIYDVVIVSAETAKEHPEWLTKTLATVEEATQFCTDHLSEAAEATASTFECSPEEVVSMCETVYLYTMKDNVEAMADGGWLYESLTDIRDFYAGYGEIDGTVDYSKVVDDSFLKK